MSQARVRFASLQSQPLILLAAGVVALAGLMGSVTAHAASAKNKNLRATQAQLAPVPVVEAPRVETPQPATEVRRGFHIEAFIEPEVRFTNKDTVTDRGFTLNDAAIYLTKSFGSSEAVIDLPFANSETGAAFAFDVTRAQAYFNFDREKYFAKVGQFDTPFGLERNDSRDRFFMDAGFVKSFMIPETHMGIQGGLVVEGGPLTLLAQVSNPNNNSRMADQNPEFGFQARINATKAHGAAGIFVNDAKGPGDNKTNMLVDVTAGAAIEKILLDGEFALRKFAGSDKTAVGFLGSLAYLVNPDLALGGRLEYVKDLPAPSGFNAKSLFSFAAGPSFKLEEGILLRADFTLANYKPDVPGASDETVFGVSGGLLASF